MRLAPHIPAASHPDPGTRHRAQGDQISQNINAVHDVYTRSELNSSRSHNR
jgi:hypothetical protein